MASKYGSDVSGQPLFDGDCWIQAAGGLAKKGRIYAFGDRETARHILGEDRALL